MPVIWFWQPGMKQRKSLPVRKNNRNNPAAEKICCPYDAFGKTPLFHVKNKELLNFYLERPELKKVFKDREGRNPLHTQRNLETLYALAWAGVDVNQQDAHGNTLKAANGVLQINPDMTCGKGSGAAAGGLRRAGHDQNFAESPHAKQRGGGRDRQCCGIFLAQSGADRSDIAGGWRNAPLKNYPSPPAEKPCRWKCKITFANCFSGCGSHRGSRRSIF